MFHKTIPARLIQQAAICGVLLAVPVIAFAQYKPLPEAAQIESPIEPTLVSANAAETVAAAPGACAEQHWPYYSKDCLRGVAAASEPRRVSLVASSIRPAPPVKAVPSARKRQHR